MGKSIYVADLYGDGRPNLLKVFIKKDTPKAFALDTNKDCVHIVGDDTPIYLYKRQLHKLGFRWRYTAQEGLELLRELTAENVRLKSIALEQAKSEHGYVERCWLAAEEKKGE